MNFTASITQTPEATKGAQLLALRAFLISLAIFLGAFVTELALFVLLFPRIPSIFQARRQSGLRGCLAQIFGSPNVGFISSHGLDAYFFLRYLSTLLRISLLLLLLTLPVLIPLNVIGYDGADAVAYLERLTWANIGRSRANLYWVHLGISLVAISVICFIIYGEYRLYNRVYFDYVRKLRDSGSHTSMLVTDIPQYCGDLVAQYSIFPGGVRKIDFINIPFRRGRTAPVDLDRRPASQKSTAAVIVFHRALSAYIASRVPLSSKFAELNPHLLVPGDEVLPENLRYTCCTLYLRSWLVTAAVCSLAVLWAVPVSFAGSMSQLVPDVDSIWWLKWTSTAPSWLLTLAKGSLPQVIAVVMNLALPFLLHSLSSASQAVTKLELEQVFMTYQFNFLFTQNVLAISVSSSVTAIVRDATIGLVSLVRSIGQNVPKAGTYFCSYIVLQGVSLVATNVLQVPTLLRYILSRTNRGQSTPVLPELSWGLTSPAYSCLINICIVYSVVSPLVLVFGAAVLGFLLLAHRYQLLYASTFHYKSNGQLYLSALNQIFVGLYLMECSLIGLFLVTRDERGHLACAAHAIIMLFAAGLTSIFHHTLKHKHDPRSRYPLLAAGDDVSVGTIRTQLCGFWKFILLNQENEGALRDALAALVERQTATIQS